MRNLIEQSGGRRFLLSVMAGVSATALQWFGKLDPAGTTYGLLMAGCVGAYIAGNTTQKVKQGAPEDRA